MFQARAKPHERLYWNRILLYVWPTLDLKPDELNEIVHRLAPPPKAWDWSRSWCARESRIRETGEFRDMVVRISRPAGTRVY